MSASPKIAEKVKHIYKQLYPWKSRFELSSHLCKSIFYNSDGVIALNKPFGVGLKNLREEYFEKLNKSKPVNVLHTQGVGSTYTFEDTLPTMREELKLPNLVVVKTTEKLVFNLRKIMLKFCCGWKKIMNELYVRCRTKQMLFICLSRYNSGVAILAENEKVAAKIQKSLFLAKPRSFFHSTFYIVSPNIPIEGSNGIEFKERVGIAMQKNPKHDVAQPVIVRDFSINSVKRNEVDPAHVSFLVKSTSPNNNSTLVELKSNTTRRNMLRIYCADMLMPILGDHLYSCRVINIKGAPAHLHPLHLKPGSSYQKLPEEILSALKLRQPENSTTVPLHVHLRSVTLVDFNGRNSHLTLTAPFTDIFRWTCEALRLAVPDDAM